MKKSKINARFERIAYFHATIMFELSLQAGGIVGGLWRPHHPRFLPGLMVTLKYGAAGNLISALKYNTNTIYHKLTLHLKQLFQARESSLLPLPPCPKRFSLRFFI